MLADTYTRRITNTWWWKLLDGSDVPWYEWVGLVAGIVTIGAGIWFVMHLRSFFGDGDDPAGSHHEMLTQMGELHREGVLSAAEYRSIKNQLIQHVDGRPPRQVSTRDENLTSAEAAREDKMPEDS